MKNVYITSNLNLPSPEIENAVSEKIQALVLDVRLLLDGIDNYSIHFGIDSQKVEIQNEAA